MFGQTDPKEPQGDVVARAWRAALRGRLLGGLAAVVVVVLIGGGAFVSAQWSAAVSDTCDTWEPVDITIEDLIALKHRKNAWQAAMDEDAALMMSDSEVNAILHKSMPYELLATFRGDKIQARLTAPLEQGCLNVTFSGRAWVAGGVAHFVPDELVVGTLELSGVLGGKELALSADLTDGWVDPSVLDALRNAERIVVKDSAVYIQLYDRRKVW